MRLSEAGELGLLRRARAARAVVGIEHDAAELADGLVVTQDALVEGVHFRLDWLSWRDLGFRAAAVNLSDLAASGARAGGASRLAGAPGETRLDDVRRALRGHCRDGRPGGRRRHDPGRPVSALVTALGRSERVPGRAGARPGDISSSPARSGARARHFASSRYVRPPVRTEEGLRLGREATAMLDLSDGLAADAGHIAAALRLSPRDRPRARCRSRATLDDLSFGEDFELLATLPSNSRWRVRGDRALSRKGRVVSPPELRGYEHFALG